MRFNNIQLLRLVAAVGVVLFHLGCHAPELIGVDPAILRFAWVGGYAVPLFFALSGFVLSHAIQAARPGRFLFARFLRLYPGYWLALLGAVLLMRLRFFTEHDRWLIYFVNLTELTLWPAGASRCQYLLGGLEWSLIYEVFLSVALAGLVWFGGVRRLPLLAFAWLSVVAVKMILCPGFAFDTFPHWSTIALSAHVVPFLLGILIYPLRDRGRRWRWVVLPATVAIYVGNPVFITDPELHWGMWGVWSAMLVWLALQFHQLSDRNFLVRLGDYTYGLFLFHVPLILVVYHAAARHGWVGRVEVVWTAGVVALLGGLLFGQLDHTLYARLRPLAKARPADLIARWRRVLSRVRARRPGTGFTSLPR